MTPSTRWQPAQIGDQSGRTAVVTGPTLGGLGHHTALELARRGARVVLAGRNPDKTTATIEAIRAEVPEADLVGIRLDLASLASVREAAASIGEEPRIDLLINNAGVMSPPRGRTVDGFETQLGTNHLGPFLLTGLLLPALARTDHRLDHRARVVTVSSQLHRVARRAPLDDPCLEKRRYNGFKEYGASKLANLLFTFELDRRLQAAGLAVDAMAAHPGFAGTHLATHGRYGRSSGGIASIVDASVRSISQPAAHGAWPTLMAATADLAAGSYVGPSGLGEMRGAPTLVSASGVARNTENQRRLWDLSEAAVGLSWP